MATKSSERADNIRETSIKKAIGTHLQHEADEGKDVAIEFAIATLIGGAAYLGMRISKDRVRASLLELAAVL